MSKKNIFLTKSFLKKFVIFIFLFYITLDSFARPKKIKTEEEYIHTKTSYKFPLQIDEFKREDIYSFDKNKENIGVNYKTYDLSSTVTVYVYPAGAAVEDRLRDEYKISLYAIASGFENGFHAFQKAVSYKKDGFKVNGFKAEVKDIDYSTIMSVYECGEWFFKLRITSKKYDVHWVDSIEQKFLDIYNPTNLVKISKLKDKATFSIYKNAFIDSIMLGSIMGSGYKKIEWIYENIDSLEKMSGFQGSYLVMHIEALKEFLEFEKRFPNTPKGDYTKEYLKELKSIVNNGFLEEFIMDQYGMLMIVPEDLILDFDEYNKWKSNNPIKIVNLKTIFYLIWYDLKE